MERSRAALRSHPLATGVVALVLGMACLVLPPAIEGPAGESLHELAIAAPMLVVVALVGGVSAVRPSVRGFGFALRKAIPLLVVAAFPLVMTIVALVAMPEALGLGELSFGEISPIMPLLVASSVALSLAVALMEETLFRGLLTSALVERFGRASSSVLGASVAASLVFGAAHVLPELLGTAITASALVQALCKLLTSGAIGLLLAAVYLRTHNLWASVLVHALNDLCALLPAFLLAAGMVAAGGTASAAADSAVETSGLATSVMGAEGILSSGSASDGLLAVGSLLLTAFYIPVVVVAVGQLGRVDPGEGTIFSAAWRPRSVGRERRASPLPVSPATKEPDDGGA